MSSNLTITSKRPMNSGYEIPLLGYGVYQTPEGVASSVVQHAFKVGYRHVDSAAGYKNEEQCAKGMLESGVPRDQMFFTSKVHPGKINYKDAKQNIEETIQNTKGLNYVDLMLLHAPYGGTEARLGAWQALVEAVEDGKIRSIGVSNYGVRHLEELEKWIKDTESTKGKGKAGVLSVNQVELHPWCSRPDIVEWCEKRGILLQAYSPLARGARSQRLEEPVLHELGKKHGKSPAQILVRWSLQKGFSPLPKSVTPERIEENANVYDFELSADDMKRLDTGVHEITGWDPTTTE